MQFLGASRAVACFCPRGKNKRKVWTPNRKGALRDALHQARGVIYHSRNSATENKPPY